MGTGDTGGLGYCSDVTRCPPPAMEIVWVVSHPFLLPWYLEQDQASLDPSEDTFEPSVFNLTHSEAIRLQGELRAPGSLSLIHI